MSINTDKVGYPVAETKTKGRYNKSEIVYFDPEADDTDEIDAIELNKKGAFEAIPPSLGGDVERDVYFISGMSGSGKSTFTAQLIDKYRKAGITQFFAVTDQEDRKFGKCKYININDFVKLSNVDDVELQKKIYDKEKIKFKHLKKFLELDEIIEQEIKLNELKPKKLYSKPKYELIFDKDELQHIFNNSVIFFDDYETNKDVKLIEILRDHLLTQGRHYKCNMIIANHQMNGGNAFKLIKAETTNYVIFSLSLEFTRESLFKTYIGFKRRQRNIVDKLLLKSRWVTYNIKNHLIISQRTVINMTTV